MAPEQIEAFLNPELWGKVGAGADVYSLGLVLARAAHRSGPELPGKSLSPARALRHVLDRRPLLDASVRRFNPAIPHALEAIVAKCLAFSAGDRYPDADSLVQDLERFLQRKPLATAVNPSRRERMSNWALRHQKAFKVAAGVLGVAIALAAVASAINSARLESAPPKLQLETSASFQTAISHLEEGEPSLATGPLRELEKQNPYSCVIKAHLAFALGTNETTEYEAEKALRDALAIADSTPTLTAWARVIRNSPVTWSNLWIRPSSVPTRRQKSTTRKIARTTKRETERSRGRLTTLRRMRCSLHSSWIPVQKSSSACARTEQFFGNYASAYERLSRLIESAIASKSGDASSLFFNRKLRGWVAFRWIEKLREEGRKPDEQTFTILKQAESDLRRCRDYLDGSSFSDSSQQLKEYHVLHDMVRAMLTRVEVELDLSVASKGGVDYKGRASEHLKNAGAMLEELKAFAIARRLDVHQPTGLIERWTQSSQRLQGLSSNPRPSAPARRYSKPRERWRGVIPLVPDARDRHERCAVISRIRRFQGSTVASRAPGSRTALGMGRRVQAPHLTGSAGRG